MQGTLLEVSRHSISILELQEIWLCLLLWAILLEGHLIQIQLDSTTIVVSYITHQEGTKGLTMADPVLGRTSTFGLVLSVYPRHRHLAGRLPQPAALEPV